MAGTERLAMAVRPRRDPGHTHRLSHALLSDGLASRGKWLPEDEREWIGEELRREKEATARAGSYTVWQALRKKEVIILTLVYFLAIIGIYGFVIWFPTIVKRATGLPNMAVTLLSALPYVAGLAAMLWNGWHSDRTGERRWHTARAALSRRGVPWPGALSARTCCSDSSP